MRTPILLCAVGVTVVLGVCAAGASAAGGRLQLYLVNADGSGLRRLTDEALSGENQTPAWSPDGRQIIFKSGADSLNTPGSYDGTDNRFAVINADGTGLHLVGPGKLDCGVSNPLLSNPACYASDPAWQRL